MKTILVTTDFSEASMNAAIYATKLARDIGGDIKLLHVNIPVESFNQSPVILKSERALHSSENQLEIIKANMETHSNGEVEIQEVLATGEFFTEMHNYCKQINPYLVIMGSQGSTATERFLMGSNSVHAMRNLPYPLLTIPTGSVYTSIKKIALASDFTDTISIPMDTIKMFRTDFNAQLEVIHVGKNKETDPDVIIKSEVMQDQLRASNATYHFISQDNTEEGILTFTETNQIDILIVIPKQYGFLEQLFHKSISKQLILNSKVPVMAIHELS